MDGLLIDSEPHWQQAGMEALKQFNINLTLEQYHTSTGLRTPEWIEYWFNRYLVNMKHSASTIKLIEDKAIELIQKKLWHFKAQNTYLTFLKKEILK